MASRTRLPSPVSGEIVEVSGQFVELQSGASVSALVSGTVQVASGTHVQISGQHVYVESGVSVVAQSGLGVLISGQHIYVESGVHAVVESGLNVIPQSGVGVVIQSGAGVLISGQHVYVESGVQIASGIHVIALEETQDLDDGTIAPSVSHPVIITLGYIYDGQGWTRLSVSSLSGIGVVIQSGAGVLISGQHVYVESGVYLASGIYQASGVGVRIQSGAGVLISGQMVSVASGADVQIAVYEPVGVTRNSGAVTQVLADSVGRLAIRVDTHTVMTPVDIQAHQSGVYLVSGEYVYVASGSIVTVLSGVNVVIQSGAGVRIQSGAGVLISGQHVYVESGVYLASGTIVTVSGNIVTLQGAVAIQSGEIHIMSGAVTIYLLSSEPIINTSGNPMVVGAISHGIPLWSSAVISVTVKALSVNSGDIYLGGFKSGQGPYSGQGFLLEPGEAINVDVDNTGKVHQFAEVSGDRVTYMGITG